ncbi:MAG: choice-of-anchor J domain-containing protein [Cytophagales bacterium]|nr:choice-of-anchor J domain-containing protein [Cytophagales bacterium]
MIRYMGKYIDIHWRFFIWLTVLVITFPSLLFAQKRCSTVEYEAYRRGHDPKLESKKSFEDWLNKRITERKKLPAAARRDALVLTVPVVVHIIHNGEAVGDGSNISDAQVISQIEVINEDFRRFNSDASETLPVFQDVADDMQIEFILARQDPEGLPTNGIVRVQGNQPNFGLNDAAKLSALSYWPAEDYLNIWVADLAFGLLGFAQFPVSSLEGLEDAPNNRLTDGVVLRYQSFGSSAKGSFPVLIPPFDRGRTTTHELGHFFGLRHTWGDGGCSVDDFCDDTPPASSEHEGCNLSRQSCGELSMVQNYMDYTDDACMNLFTTDQKARMRVVIENSPRRQSLTTSPGLVAPSPVADDLGIKEILTPAAGQCQNTFAPEIELKNFGTNDITSARLTLLVNGLEEETIDVTLSLAPQDIQTISFAALNDVSIGSNDISFQIIETNGGDDNNPTNNIQSLNYLVSGDPVISIDENFEIFQSDWIIDNPDESITWEIRSVPGVTSIDNRAIMLNFFNYINSPAELDQLIGPPLDLSGARSATLSFRLAYANRPNNPDRLTVAVSTDCGNNFENVIFDESGEDLASTESVQGAFVPEDRFAWKTITLDLNDYLGANEVLVAFKAQNAGGNNLYLDDIRVTAEQQYDIDLSIEEIIAPAVISCENTVTPSILIKNLGTVPVNNFSAGYNVNGEPQTGLESLTLNPGEERTLEFQAITLEDGDYAFDFRLINPSGQADQNPDNNSAVINQRTDNFKVEIPVRERFDDTNPGNSGWRIFNPDEDITWLVSPANGNGNNNNAAFINGFNYENAGEEDWLISPLLDMSKADRASMTFKFSYANVTNYVDRLKIFVSGNCGESFNNLIYVLEDASLGVIASDQPWSPEDENDWENGFIDLNAYAGNDAVRVAFVFENQFGNNLYLDDIEFFLTSDENLPVPETNTFILYPNPIVTNTFNTSFNLSDKEDIRLAIVDTKGKVVYEKILESTLNQTYTLELPQLRNGVYFVKATGRGLSEVQRLLIQR